MFDWLAPFVGAMMIVFGCFSFLVAREDAEANSLLVGEGRVLYSTASITLGKDGMHYYGCGLGCGVSWDFTTRQD